MRKHLRVLFSEPSGRGTGLANLSFGLLCLLVWAFFSVVHDGGHLMLFLGIGLALSGCAESLPPDRRRSAGVLRVTSAGVILAFLGLWLLAPDVVLG